jgi:WD40 repeat protein
VRLCDAGTGTELLRFTGHKGKVPSLVLTPDNQSVISADLAGSVCLWDRDSGTLTRRFSVSKGHGVHSLALSPDGTLLAAAADPFPEDVADRNRLWAEAGRPGSSVTIRDLVGRVSLWELPAGTELHPFAPGPGGVRAVAFAPDGRTLAVGGDYGSIVFTDARGGRPRLLEITPAAGGDVCGPVTALAFSRDGGALACGCGSNVVYVFDPRTGKRTHRLMSLCPGGPSNKSPGIYSLAFAPDGQTLAGSGCYELIHMWEMPSGKQRLYDRLPAR